jgi:hypothetical protein
VAEHPQLGPEFGGVRVVELVEDRQGVPPGLAGRGGVAAGVLGVTEVGEDLGLVVPIADLPEQDDGALIAVRRQPGVAEVVVGVAEAVPRGRLAAAVAEVLMEVECALARGRSNSRARLR